MRADKDPSCTLYNANTNPTEVLIVHVLAPLRLPNREYSLVVHSRRFVLCVSKCDAIESYDQSYWSNFKERRRHVEGKHSAHIKFQ